MVTSKVFCCINYKVEVNVNTLAKPSVAETDPYILLSLPQCLKNAHSLFYPQSMFVIFTNN